MPEWGWDCYWCGMLRKTPQILRMKGWPMGTSRDSCLYLGPKTFLSQGLLLFLEKENSPCGPSAACLAILWEKMTPARSCFFPLNPHTSRLSTVNYAYHKKTKLQGRAWVLSLVFPRTVNFEAKIKASVSAGQLMVLTLYLFETCWEQRQRVTKGMRCFEVNTLKIAHKNEEIYSARSEHWANEHVKRKGDHSCLLLFPSCHHGVTSKTESIHLDENNTTLFCS